MSQSPIYFDIDNNKAIIIALKAGDENVFDAVYRYYFRRLCAFCSQYVHEQEEIEEIVQETMMWLWENRCSLLPELTLKTLLFTIVKNKALNRLSHFEIKRRVHQEIIEKYEGKFDNPDFYLGNELFQLYEKTLQQLPKEYREAYEMTRNKHLTHKEIAQKTKYFPADCKLQDRTSLKVAPSSFKRLSASIPALFRTGLYEKILLTDLQ